MVRYAPLTMCVSPLRGGGGHKGAENPRDDIRRACCAPRDTLPEGDTQARWEGWSASIHVAAHMITAIVMPTPYAKLIYNQEINAVMPAGLATERSKEALLGRYAREHAHEDAHRLDCTPMRETSLSGPGYATRRVFCRLHFALCAVAQHRWLRVAPYSCPKGRGAMLKDGRSWREDNTALRDECRG